jgi:hypothetical protein
MRLGLVSFSKTGVKASHLSQEHVVGLVFDRHEHDEDAIEELEAFQRRHAHVKEHT